MASKFGKSFGVGVCSLYWTTPFLSITNAERAAVSPTPASIGNTTSYCLMTTLFKSLASVMPIFSFAAHAACANGLSTLTAMTSAPRPAYASRPAGRLHISAVQTPVNASGKNSSTVFFLPKLLLNLTSTSAGVLDLRVKSGALEPTGIAIIYVFYLVDWLRHHQMFNIHRARVKRGFSKKPIRAAAAKEAGQGMSTEVNGCAPGSNWIWVRKNIF